MGKKVNFIKTQQAGAGHQSGSRHLRRAAIKAGLREFADSLQGLSMKQVAARVRREKQK